jgi:fatty-acyl-CoA synthase
MTTAAAPRWREQTLGAALLWAAQTHGERTALVCGDARTSYETLCARAMDFACGLLELGVATGDKVALWMGDRTEWMVARWAVPMIGAILVPVNTRFRHVDLEYVLAQSDASTLIMSDAARGVDYLEQLALLVPDGSLQAPGDWHSARLPRLKRVLVAGSRALPGSVSAFDAIEALGRRLRRHERAQQALIARMHAVRPGDVAQILYTSGTTSFPKGAMVCHGALLGNNEQTLSRMRLTPDDRYLSCVPLFSATGTGYTLSMLLAGATIVILDGFDARAFCETVQRERITVGFFVDTIVEDLKVFEDLASYDLSSLRTGTGAPLSTASFLWATEVLGVPELIGVFGMSETSNAVCRGDCRDPLERRSTTNGRPVEGVRIRIADVQTNATLPYGVVGEICIAGYVLMEGYYRQPEETARAIDAEGWLHSGDLGELDADGYLIYRGRVKEMIKPGGFNVATQEIEVFLKTYPGVREAVVVGVPDRRLGEVGYAYIEARPGAQLDAEAIKAHCRAAIASYKVPRHVEFVKEWPLTGSQKIRKLDLKARAVATIDAQAPGDAAPPALAPRPPDAQRFRDAMRRHATGVTIIATRDADGRPVGLTANSFSSVSLAPPLVLWCLNKRSRNLDAFMAARHYSVNVLSADQAGLAARFAAPLEDRYAGVDWRSGGSGMPLLAGCVAWFECVIVHRYDGGDHVIVVGEVLDLGHSDRPPLIHAHGGYGTAKLHAAG